MFSDGAIVVAEDNNVRKANKKEISDFLKTASEEQTSKYLTGLFPKEHEGNKLTHVMLEKENGYAYGKYADTSKLLKIKVLAQSQAKQTEPVNSVEKSDPDLEIPRDESKGKPQEFKAREDVNSPAEVRKDNYKVGPDSKNLHTNKVPRDKSGDGLDGESVSFEKENALEATSGKPDTYVQEYSENEKPESAGSKENHVAASTKPLNVKVKHAGENLHLNLVAKKEEDKKEDEKENKNDHKTDDKKDEKKDKSKKNLPPWLKKDKDEDEDDSEKTGEEKDASTNEVVELNKKLAEVTKELQKLEREINNRKVAEARREAAIGLVLAYRDRQPEKYVTAESFNSKVTEISKKMSVEAIDSALEEFGTLILAETERQKKVAQTQTGNEPVSLSHSLTFPHSNYKFASDSADSNDLASILMSNTTLGRKVANMDLYHQDQSNE